MQILKKLRTILTLKDYKSAIFLFIMVLIMAIVDIAGIASILPFVAILTNPTLIDSNMILKNMFDFLRPFGVDNVNQFLFIFGILVFVLLVSSLLIKSFTVYLQIRFVQLQEYSISKRLVEGYLHQPYSWFLNHNSANLGKSILSEASNVVVNAIRPMLELIAKSTLAILIVVLLSLTDFKLTLIVFFTLGAVYVLTLKFTKSFLSRIGKERLKANELRFLSVNEAFGASKEIKLGRLEQIYINKFSEPAQVVAKNQIYSQIINQLPRYFFEIFAFGGILLLILYLIKQTGSFVGSLPTLSLYIFAGYKLLPAIQQIYSSIINLRFASSAIDNVYDDFKSFKKQNLNEFIDNINLNREINLRNVHFKYPGNSKSTLNGINLTIRANSTVGFVGTTGSGKTTTVDIILGLLEPQKGALEIDGQIITKENFRSWQKLVGYVPQNIYLSDDSISANIAFGVDLKNIDQKAVENAAKIAKIHSFIETELPQKYQTTIGERGVRLSGGQKQRLGIARALYNKPKVLVLDEATSALDNTTEKAVMDEVYNLSLRNSTTIILVAHRLSTLEKCENIFNFDGGKVKKI